jgi:hypothetical protein
MIHLNTYSTNYGQKKNQESKCQFDFRPLKVRNHPELGVHKCCATYHWKDLDKGYNFVLYLASIKSLHNKLWASKEVGVSNLGILRFPTWESWEK